MTRIGTNGKWTARVTSSKKKEMGLLLNLSPELQRQLDEAASERGIPVDDYAIELLETELLRSRQREALTALLQTWIDQHIADDESEASNELMRNLDEYRLSDRKLYPPELEGITW